MPKTSYHLHLKGYVGGNDFDSRTVDTTLAKLGGRQVNVLIDSTGGSLATGLSICTAFNRHGEVSVHFTGLNASAATIASLGANHISMDKASMYLVHQCSMSFFEWSSMNSEQFATLIKDCEKVKADLDKMDATVAGLYASRCKRKPEELLELMKKGAWLTSAEALEWGFVDEVTELEEDAAPQLTDELMTAMVAEGMPLPQMWVPAQSTPMPAMGAQGGTLNRLVNALLSMFKNTETSTKTYMDKKFKNICGALKCESLTLTDSSASLQESQLDEVEALIEKYCAALEAKEKEIAELKAKVDAQPAETQAQVTVNNTGNGSENPDPRAEAVAEYTRTTASAKSLFDSIP